MKLAQINEAKYYQTPLVFADDWFVFKKISNGEWYITDSELWSDWLSYDKNPSDMNQKEFHDTVINILKKYNGESPSGWRKYADWFGEMYTSTEESFDDDYQRSVQELEQLARQRT